MGALAFSEVPELAPRQAPLRLQARATLRPRVRHTAARGGWACTLGPMAVTRHLPRPQPRSAAIPQQLWLMRLLDPPVAPFPATDHLEFLARPTQPHALRPSGQDKRQHH